MSSLRQPANPHMVQPEFHERVWGSRKLEPLFPNPDRKIGEVWFPESASPVLVKFLFTTEDLSVQVHPDDQLAQSSGHARGKTEMWHILRADPSARIALGFKTRPTLDQVREAALDGSIMDLLRWIPVQAGDSWFIPAGAVHAVGAGITLCEVQQNSDVTYRLFDYGRNRGLHLEESMQALNLDFEPLMVEKNANILAACPYFTVERIALSGEFAPSALDLLIALHGTGTLNGESFFQGNVARVQPGARLQSENLQLLRVSTKSEVDRLRERRQAPG